MPTTDAMSNYLEGKLRGYVFRGEAFTQPATLYIALSTADPTEDASGLTEPSGGAYARASVTSNTTNWTAVSSTDGLTDNGVDISFIQATGNWGTISHVAVMDALTSGNMLFYGALTAAKTVNTGDTFKFATGDLDIEFK